MAENNISTHAREYAIEHLNETDNKRISSLNEIRTWLREERPWIRARTEDKYLLPFLRGCKFDLNKTKQKITNYYTMKKERPEWFENRNPFLPEIQELVKMGVFVPLKLPHENQLVIIIRTAAHDPKRHKWDDVFKAGKMILDVACMEHENAQIYGVIAIFDMTGMSFAHYKSFTPALIKKAVFAWQNYHVRPKQLEFIRAPLYINVALNIFKSFMTEKMKNRVRVHFGGVEKVHEVVVKEILPSEYGGDGESVSVLGHFWFEKLLGYRDWFAEDEMFKSEQE